MPPTLAVGVRGDHVEDMKSACAAILACLFFLPAGLAHAENLPENMKPPPARPEATVEKPDAKAALPAQEAACRTRLEALGVDFAEHAPIEEPEGCSALHPLSVSGLAGGIELRPDAVMTCAMAEATALFVRDHADPISYREFGAGLSAINQVSSYVCRPRNGTARLSEHAFANALDWGSLELADGTVIDVAAHRRSEPRRARLISDLREAACGPFKTVLGPGSDADHADHFHFDLAERRGGATFCQ